MEFITPWLKNNNPSSKALQVYKGLMNFSITNKILHLRIIPPPPPHYQSTSQENSVENHIIKSQHGWLVKPERQFLM